MKKKKKFDCFEMKWKVREEISKEIQDLSSEDQIDYFNTEALQGPLGEWYKRVKKIKK